MMMTHDLMDDNPTERVYRVDGGDGDIGYLTVNKQDETCIAEGKFNFMFTMDFIKQLAVGTLKFQDDPPKHFCYGVG